MNKKILVIAGFIILVLYFLFVYGIPSSPFAQPEEFIYASYNKLVGDLVFLGSLTAFFVITGFVFTIRQGNGVFDKKASRWWGFGFSMVVLPLICLSIYANPHGLFSWEYYPPVVVAARTEKINLYRNLDISPEIVFFGSSRSFALPADYVRQHLGYTAFNMSVNSGGLVDFVPQARFVFSEGNDFPYVLIIELIYPDLSLNWNFEDLQEPFALVPYM